MVTFVDKEADFSVHPAHHIQPVATNSCCFLLACPIQTNQSESSSILRYRRSNALVRRLALVQSASNWV